MEKIKTKDKILLAALDLFSEKGYDEASIDLIAEAVGIKGPSIYAHYTLSYLIRKKLTSGYEDTHLSDICDRNFFKK